MPAKDEIGNKYGRLTVLSRSKNNHRGDAQWLCRCDCGSVIITKGISLRSGHAKSCGCLQKEVVRKQGIKNTADLLGKKFGKLTVLERIQGDSKNVGKWVCQCDCGGMAITTSNKLITGWSQSCGCAMSRKVEFIAKTFSDLGIKFVKEYTFPDLKSDKNRPLRFDFAVMSGNKLLFLLEYDGIQHSDPENFFWNERIPINDEAKNLYCKKNKIILYRISHDQNVSKELLGICKKEGLL